MSLSKPHPMWEYATTSYEVNKTITVSRMISGRFRCGSLLRHFYTNISGICELCTNELEDLPHILIPRCPNLHQRAAILMRYAREKLSCSDTDAHRAAYILFEKFMSSEDDNKIQFVLDPSTIPDIIAAEQAMPGTLKLILNVTTTWCHSLNKVRTKLLRN